MSTTDQVYIRESLPAKDRRPNHRAMPPTKIPQQHKQ